jgi:hypothetical protein
MTDSKKDATLPDFPRQSENHPAYKKLAHAILVAHRQKMAIPHAKELQSSDADFLPFNYASFKNRYEQLKGKADTYANNPQKFHELTGEEMPPASENASTSDVLATFERVSPRDLPYKIFPWNLTRVEGEVIKTVQIWSVSVPMFGIKHQHVDQELLEDGRTLEIKYQFPQEFYSPLICARFIEATRLTKEDSIAYSGGMTRYLLDDMQVTIDDDGQIDNLPIHTMKIRLPCSVQKIWKRNFLSVTSNNVVFPYLEILLQGEEKVLNFAKINIDEEPTIDLTGTQFHQNPQPAARSQATSSAPAAASASFSSAPFSVGQTTSTPNKRKATADLLQLSQFFMP